jgi:chromosome segregation ATPase
MSATFDTLGYARRLEAGGVPAAQAQAHAGALADVLDARERNLVTTSTLRAELCELRAELRAEMADLRDQLRREMADLRGELAELRSEMADLRSQLHAAVADARGEFKAIHAELRMLRWLLGLIATGVAALLARSLF